MNLITNGARLLLTVALGTGLLTPDASAAVTYTMGITGGTVSMTVDPAPGAGISHYTEGNGLFDLDFMLGGDDFTLADSLGGAYVDFVGGVPDAFNYVGILPSGAVLSASGLAFTYVTAAGDTIAGSIPEPASLALMAIAVAGLALAGRRRPAGLPRSIQPAAITR